jgi:DNA replication protein DnaC
MDNQEIDKAVRGIVEPTSIELGDLLLLKEKLKEKKGDPAVIRQEFEVKAKFLLAGIPPSYWGIGFDDFKGDKDAKRLVKLYCEHLAEAIEQGQGIIFSGAHGTGKTTLACLIGKTALMDGFTVRYISIAKILDLINESFASPAAKHRLDTMIERVEILILDDLGKEYRGVREQLTPMMTMKLDSLLRERLNRIKVTIGTTNYDLKAIKDHYGESVLSAIYGACKVVEVKGGDYRTIKNEKFWKDLDGRNTN